jgi:eukaryotic-like serine/threonine-protein kinase
MARAITKAGRYEIVSELGRGSMGVVYRGFDPVIGRSVAIKTMLIEGLTAAEFQEYKARFQREAQAAGILAHPNIVTVYDFGEDAGVLYLAMEFLEGKSLQDLVEKQSIHPVETIIPMFEQVCSALDHAHSHNIVHRDIKPANIMILSSGLAKVTDFGIAKIMSMGMTQAGQILGTPNYMSPEQVKGRAVDGRSDIFALGVILYELVTGEKPFGGQNITTVIYKIINENPIPPRELDGSIHPGLSFVISKALAKNPDERYQTCRELAEGLKTYKNLSGSASPNATVVIKVPPIQASPAEPPRVAKPRATPEIQPVAAEPVRARPVSSPPQPQASPRPVPPPAFAAIRPAPKGTSPLVWVLLGLLIFGGVGGAGYYFLYLNGPPRTPQGQPEVTPEVAPVPLPTLTGEPATTSPGSVPSASEQPATGETTVTPGSNSPSAATETPQPANPPAAATSKAPPKTETPAKQVAPPAPLLKYGKIFVNSNPAGAQISVDGRSDPDWVTPRTIEGLQAGMHKVILSREGYSTATRDIAVEAGRTEAVNLELAGLAAAPPAASRRIQPAPARSTPSPSQPKTEELPTPRPATPSAPATGVWGIKTKPPGVEVLIDGKSYGLSPVTATLPVGNHTCTIKMNNVEVFSGQVELGAGEAKFTTVSLE